MKTITLEKGTIVKKNGIPMELTEDIKVNLNEDNKELLEKESLIK